MDLNTNMYDLRKVILDYALIFSRSSFHERKTQR